MCTWCSGFNDLFFSDLNISNSIIYALINQSLTIHYTNNLNALSSLFNTSITKDTGSSNIIFLPNHFQIDEEFINLSTNGKTYQFKVEYLNSTSILDKVILFLPDAVEIIINYFFEYTIILVITVDFQLETQEIVSITDLEEFVLKNNNDVRINMVLSGIDKFSVYKNHVENFIENKITVFEENFSETILLVIPIIQFFYMIFIILTNNEFNNKKSDRELLWQKGATFKQIIYFMMRSKILQFTCITLFAFIVLLSQLYIFNISNQFIIPLMSIFGVVTFIYIVSYVSMIFLKLTVDRIELQHTRQYKIKHKLYLGSIMSILIFILTLNLISNSVEYSYLTSFINYKFINDLGSFLLFTSALYLFSLKKNAMFKYFRAIKSPSDLWQSIIKTNSKLNFVVPLFFLLLMTSHITFVFDFHNSDYVINRANQLEFFSDITLELYDANPT